MATATFELFYVANQVYNKTNKEVQGGQVVKIPTGETGNILQLLDYNPQTENAECLMFFPTIEQLPNNLELHFMDRVLVEMELQSVGAKPRFLRIVKKVANSPFKFSVSADSVKETVQK